MVKYNFEEDLKAELHIGFSSFGVKLPYREKLVHFLLDYLTISKKLIRPIKRGVFYSPEFQKEIGSHPKKGEIEYLAESLMVGRDVNFFQSKRLFQSKDAVAWH